MSDDPKEEFPIPPGQWVRTRAIKVSDLPTVKRNRDLLVQLVGVLKSQVDEDQLAILSLEEQLMKVKRGGSNG